MPQTGTAATATAPVDDTILIDCARSVLARTGGDGWLVTTSEAWCSVDPGGADSPVQGWKLHVSATPLSAPLVLARSVPVLVGHRCPFKFASTLSQVERLASRAVDRSAGGKFLTAYPDGGDEELRDLAGELHLATEGLPGPVILSDRPYCPGSLVHYRFGAFRGVRMLSNDGTHEAMLVAPGGELVLDRRTPQWSPPAWAPHNPFAQQASPSAGPASPPKTAPPKTAPPKTAGPKPVLLDGRYVVREVIRHSFAGGVYRATDKTTGRPVVLKQARPHTGSNLMGRDVRDDRRREADMLELFATSGITPQPVALFEQQGDLFVAQEALDGATLRQWVTAHIEPDDDGPWGIPSPAARRIAGELVSLVEAVHARDLVIRDLNPNNVIVTERGDLRLIDLELLARPGERVIRCYTPAYAAPEQMGAARIGPAPQVTADLYSLGATLFFLACGSDPLLAADAPAARPERDRLARWLTHAGDDNAAARCLADTIVALLHENPARRPTLRDVRALLNSGGPETAGRRPTLLRAISEADLDRLVEGATAHLLATANLSSPERVWPTTPFGATTDPLNVQHGAAGVLAVLARVDPANAEPRVGEVLGAAASWIARRLAAEPRLLPGLYFGRSGTAWALFEAAQSLGDSRLGELAMDLARRIPVCSPNPDVCHGTAGAGLTQLRFWEATGAEDFLDRARAGAGRLMEGARYRDGMVSWPIPRDLDSTLAGAAHFGFAHGVAGVGAFLLAAARATSDRTLREVALHAAQTLAAAAQLDRGAAYWPAEEGGPLRTNWCSGSSGVGTFLVRMWQETGDDRLAELAAQAAVAVHRSRWQMGTAQCHGLAGDGEYLLDLAEAFGDERYREWAGQLALNIWLRHALRDGRVVIPDETGASVVADFNTGLSGVLAFLRRLRDGGPRMWLPALLSSTWGAGDHRRSAPNGFAGADLAPARIGERR